ncbi:hypothetical protein Asp14428_47260 [Actinoplanes sp. NBRC 14428]|nr:hypothetical protein Asp14428_47260 [Actinoplanes sp. NBRC 14428]
MPEYTPSLPDFTRWPSFPFEGDMRVKPLAPPVAVEPPRSGEDASDCVACSTPDDAYIWVSERWRVRAMDRPTGLPMVLILECRSHLDLGDLPNLLAAELGVMTVRLERAIRSLDGVARVHVNRWGDGSAHLHMWFLARPYGRLQLRGTFLSLWDDILPVIPEEQWRGNLALVAAWLGEFGGRAIAEPPHIHWESPATFSDQPSATVSNGGVGAAGASGNGEARTFDDGETRDLTAYAQSPVEPSAASDQRSVVESPAGEGPDASGAVESAAAEPRAAEDGKAEQRKDELRAAEDGKDEQPTDELSAAEPRAAEDGKAEQRAAELSAAESRAAEGSGVEGPVAEEAADQEAAPRERLDHAPTPIGERPEGVTAPDGERSYHAPAPDGERPEGVTAPDGERSGPPAANRPTGGETTPAPAGEK